MSILKKNKAIKLLLVLVLILVLTTACTKKQERPNIDTKEEKVPDKLKAMQEKNEDMIKDIEKIAEEMAKPEKPQKKESAGQSKQQGNQESDKSGSSGGSEAGNSEGGEVEQSKNQSSQVSGLSTKETQTKEEKIESMWEAVKKLSEDIHNSWANYEITAIKKGAKKEELSRFEEAINKVTVAVTEKNVINALFYSNEITYNMAPFFDAYKGSLEGELMRVKYFVRQVLLYGTTGDWEESEKSILQAEETMSTARARIKLNKEDQELVEKLTLSLTNLKTSIPMKNVELIKIKRDIVLKYVDEIRSKL